MNKFVGIIPAAGEGSRLGLPYPKEIHSIEPDVLYIDYALKQLQSAGITNAYIVCTPEKLRHLSAVLEQERFGVALEYVLRQPNDSRSLIGSVLRGCRRANYQQEFTNFVIVMPDTKFSYADVVKDLTSVPAPCFALFDVDTPSDFDAVYGNDRLVRRIDVKKPIQGEWAQSFHGIWGCFTLDMEAVTRLRRQLKNATKSTSGDDHLFGEIVDQDVRLGSSYYYLNVPGSYTDLGEWGRVHKHAASLIDKGVTQ